MTPFSGIVIKSTGTELTIRLSNGHELKGLTPRKQLHFGQEVIVYYDYTKGRVGRVEIPGIQELDNPIEGREVSNVIYDDEMLDLPESGAIT
jgi:hypothetical protein